MYSEMVASEAIIRHVPKAMEMMEFCEDEQPVVIQIFGSNPKSMAKAAKVVEKEFNPNGIDINFGCPVQKAAKQGFGAVQLKDAKRAGEIVRAVVASTKLPVSVKMRLPSRKLEESVEFVKTVFAAGAKIVAIHGRFATQKYKGHADWNYLRKIKDHFPDNLILGNGDVESAGFLKENLGKLDGALVGRAAKRDPGIFRSLKSTRLQRLLRSNYGRVKS